MKDIIQSYFDQEAVNHLAQTVGLDATLTQRALSLGVPMQLDALAAHATTPEGRAQLGEAISNLPRFTSVQEAVSAPGGAGNLQQAGELLAPTLLGGQAEEMVQQVTRRVGGSLGGVQKVLNMALPLLLSLLGRHGMNAVNADTMLGRLRGNLSDLTLGAAAPATTPAPTTAPTTATPVTEMVTPTVIGAVGTGTATPGGATRSANAITPGSLLELLRAELSGDNADRIGRAAGFSAGTASKATLGALPVVLSALSSKGRTEAGAAQLLGQSQEFDRLLSAEGRLNTALLGDSAEMARLEGQGRGLLGDLFGNLDSLTGRLGTALGGSGANAGRLLALLVPMVLALLGRAGRTARMSPLVMTGLLGAMGDKLPGLIPAGMGGIQGLLEAGTAATGGTVVASSAPEVRVVETAAPPPPPVTPAPVEPVVATPTVTPPPPPPPAPSTSVVTTTERKGGIPWWVWLLPLLLLGGCLLWPRDKTAPATTPPAATRTTEEGDIIVENPVSDSDLPAEPFTMSGKAAPNMHLKIEDQGQVVAESTADAEGNWTAEIPAPTVGEHTYSIIGGENAKSEFKVKIVDGAGAATDDAATTPAEGEAATGTPAETAEATTADAEAETTGAGTADTATEGTTPTPLTISEPAADAEVAGTGFNLKGTGAAPGATYELLEDGTSVGTFTAADDGSWNTDVAAPTAGNKTYVIKDQDGNEVGTLAVKVAAAEANAGECSEELSVSLSDGETVSAPFRFGGVGSGKGYAVTVLRNGRPVGTKQIPLGNGCTWSYTSDPGGKSGSENTVTYEVRPLDAQASDAAAATLNLKVRAQ